MNKEEIQSLLKEYEPIGNSDTEKLINLLNIWIKEGHLLLNESNRQDELYKILEAILSSIPTHKDETKTHDIFCATNYFKDVHRGIKFTHCTCLEQSVPQPLKPLSDITDEDAIEVAKILKPDDDYHHDTKTGKYYIKKLFDGTTYTFDKSIKLANFLFLKGYKLPIEFSLPVDNTVSETETIDFWKIQNNSLQELITEKDLEIAKLKMRIKFLDDEDIERVALLQSLSGKGYNGLNDVIKENELLTSQLSLYNKADNILKA